MTAKPLPSSRSICIREYDEDPSNKHSDRSLLVHDYHEYVLTVSEEDNGGDQPHQKQTSSRGAAATATTAITTDVSQPLVNRRRRWLQAPVRVLQELFLPIGFPASVSDGYLEYQFYDSLQGLCSYLRGVLCSAQVLQAAGVGKAEATALSAAMTWALKDGVAMLGGLLFSYTASPLFDSHVKEFRLFADFINDVGLLLDMMAPYFENHLLLVTSASGLCKTMCGLSAGATKSSITLHFAIDGNMADLNAKESTQETLVSLIGMLLGVTLAHQLKKLQEEEDSTTSSGTDADNDNNNNNNHSLVIQQVQWIIFISLTILHMWANYVGIRLLRMRTLNRERAEIVLKDIVQELMAMGETTSTLDLFQLQAAMETLPPPTHVDESLVASTCKMLWPGRCRLCLKAHLVDVLQCDDMQAVLQEFQDERYVLVVDGNNKVLVSLLTGAKAKDEVKAFVHALCLVECLLGSPSSEKGTTNNNNHNNTLQWRRDQVRRTHERVNLLFAAAAASQQQESSSSSSPSAAAAAAPFSLMAELEKKGWELHERLYLGFSRRRAQWTTVKEE